MLAKDLFSVEGRTALITGASSGIGAAMAEGLALNGAHVIAVARRESYLQDLVQKIRDQGARADYVALSLDSEDDVLQLVKSCRELASDPDILINAAGVNLRQPVDEISSDSWDQTLNINLKMPFFLARALVPAMKAQKWGKIINIASLQSQRAFANGLAYGASKGGVVQLTRAMAETWSQDGISCNAIAPGFFPTELTAPVFSKPELANKNAAQTCIGRNGELADLIGTTLFLASKASDFVTGQMLFVDGGFTAK